MARPLPLPRGLFAVGAAGAAAVAGVAVPVVELHLARRHPKLVELDHVLDGHVGHDGTGPALRCVWLGDSTAAGVGADTPDGALPRQVAAAMGSPVSLRVFAKSGARIADVVANQIPRITELDERPELVIVSVGANDVAHMTSRRQFKQDYASMLESLTGCPVVVLSVPDMASALVLAQPLRRIVGTRARLVDRWIRSTVARFANVHYVDITERPASVGRRVHDYLSADRYHPNEHGYGIWAGLVATALTSLLTTTEAAL